MPVSDSWLKRRVSRRFSMQAAGSGVLAAGLAACGRNPKSASPGPSASGLPAQASQGSPVPGGTLNIYVNYNAPLDPQVSLDHTLENDLGLRAETPDGMTWTVKLRPDARITNIPPVKGHPVEAEDVKATFSRAVNPATSNPNSGQLSMIDPAQIQTPDATTVVFKLKYPYTPFNRTLASPNYSLILPREGLTGGYDLSKVPLGSGPFTLESAVPNVDAIRIAVIPDTSQQLAQFTGRKSR